MRKRKEYVAIKIYILIHIISTLVIGIRTIVNHKSYGEAHVMTLTLSKHEIIGVLIAQVLTLAFAYIFFLLTKQQRVHVFRSRVRFIINNNKMHCFILVIIFAQIIFSFKTGNGRLGHISTSNLSSLMNILDITSFFPIYYFCCREKKKRYWANIILFCVWKLICGWTGFILIIAFYELYIRIRNNKSFLLTISTKMYFFLACGMIAAGGLIYSYLYRLKFIVRYSSDPGVMQYTDGINALVSRFTNFPVSLAGVQNHNVISQLNNLNNNWYTEIVITFRSLIPGFLWHNKDELRSFGNMVLQSIYPNLENGTSTGYLCWVYWWNILESSIYEFTIYIVAFIVFFYFTKRIIYSFETKKGLMDFLYFIVVFDVFNGSSMENLFGYGYMGLIYTIPIMFFGGIIKIIKEKKEVL